MPPPRQVCCLWSGLSCNATFPLVSCELWHNAFPGRKRNWREENDLLPWYWIIGGTWNVLLWYYCFLWKSGRGQFYPPSWLMCIVPVIMLHVRYIMLQGKLFAIYVRISMHLEVCHFNYLFLMFLSNLDVICSRLGRHTHKLCIILLLNSTMCSNLLYMANKD